jgi:hypothetical protein
MSLTVKLSYEEKILNALGHVKHKRADDFITRSTREFEAIREVLRPLYAERDEHKRQAALYHADMMNVRAQRDDARRAALASAAMAADVECERLGIPERDALRIQEEIMALVSRG